MVLGGVAGWKPRAIGAGEVEGGGDFRVGAVGVIASAAARESGPQTAGTQDTTTGADDPELGDGANARAAAA